MDDFELLNHYEVLGVAHDASPGDIDRAYRAALLREHPDRSDHPRANERASRVNEAGRVLLDPNRRRQYNPEADSRERRARAGLRQLPTEQEAADRSSEGGGDAQSHARMDADDERYARVGQSAPPRHGVDQTAVRSRRVRRSVIASAVVLASLIVAAALVYQFVLRTESADFGQPGGANSASIVSSTEVFHVQRSVEGGWQTLTGLGLASISVGESHSCGLRTDGSVVCWSRNDLGQANAPQGVSLSQVSAGLRHSCGLRTDGRVVCWGNFSLGDGKCGRTLNSLVICFENEFGRGDTHEFFSQVSAGGWHSCGLRADGAAVCWGDNGSGQADAPEGDFKQISAGGLHSCGLRADGTAVCWGSNGLGQTDAPTGRFSQISAGWSHSCGLRTDGTAVCWGSNGLGQIEAPTGHFSQISAGWSHSCGLRTDGVVVCWGSNVFGQTEAPTGRFSQVSAGWSHSCGLRTDGILVCWGDDLFANLNLSGMPIEIEVSSTA